MEIDCRDILESLFDYKILKYIRKYSIEINLFPWVLRKKKSPAMKLEGNRPQKIASAACMCGRLSAKAV